MIQRFVLLPALLSILAATTRRGVVASVETSDLRAPSEARVVDAAPEQRRRELTSAKDWWYTVLNAVHFPCTSNTSGHCAHYSHRLPAPSISHSGGGGGGGSSGGGSSGGGGSGGSGGGGGGGGGGGSSGCDDDGGCDDDTTTNDDAEAVAGDDDDDYSVWGADGHDDDDDDYSVWGADGHDDDGDDAYIAANDDDAEWEADGWDANNLNSAARASGSGGGYPSMSSGAKAATGWGMAAIVAAVVGGAAFVATKKRKRREEDRNYQPRDTSDIPQDVYIQQDVSVTSSSKCTMSRAAAVVDDDYADGDYNQYDEYRDDDDGVDGETVPEGANVEVDERQFAADNDNAVEMATVKSSKSRAASIRSALSRTGRSVKSFRSTRSIRSFWSKKSTGAAALTGGAAAAGVAAAAGGEETEGNYRAPEAPPTAEVAFASDDSIATRESAFDAIDEEAGGEEGADDDEAEAADDDEATDAGEVVPTEDGGAAL